MSRRPLKRRLAVPREPKPTIVLAVTVDRSLRLLQGQPQFLVESGWHVHVVSAADSTKSRESFLGPSAGVRFHSLPMVRRPSPIHDATALVRWLLLLRRVRPDVVCVGTPKASLIGLVAARTLSVPGRIYLLRGLRFESAEGLLRQLLIAVERATCRLATEVVAVSPSVRTAALAEGIGDPDRLSVLGAGSSNGVAAPDSMQLRALRARRATGRRALGLSTDSPTVGYVGRLTTDKGVLDLAKACAELVGAGVDLQLMMVGAEDESGHVVEVKRLLEGANVRYALTGYVERPEEMMALMDVFCLPSTREGLPNVCLEAAALELPVVTTTATGCCDAVIPDVTGLVYPVSCIDGLVRSLQRLVLDEPLRLAMGAAGSEWVRAVFGRDVVWGRYESFYRSLVPSALTPGDDRRASREVP